MGLRNPDLSAGDFTLDSRQEFPVLLFLSIAMGQFEVVLKVVRVI